MTAKTQYRPSLTGTLGNNGWYVSDVEVSFSVVDAESAVSGQTGCDTQTVTTDTNGTTFTCEANSDGGTAASHTVKRDTTAPTISFDSRTPAANASGWNKTNVLVKRNCADVLSGTVNSSEGTNQSATGICTDNAGNTAQNTQNGINVDKTAPVLNPSVSPDPVLIGGAGGRGAAPVNRATRLKKSPHRAAAV